VRRGVDRVLQAGYKEVVLTGVHLGSYGRDLVPPSSLAQLLRALERSVSLGRGRVRFRISSLEPMDCTPEVVELVADSDCFAQHFHLPLQHASDSILAAMQRPYTIAYYRALVEAIHSRMPDVSIGSDVIVGFPGETDSDFEELAAYLQDAPLTHLHVFPYSDRPGTPASLARNKVAGPVVRERARRVREIGHSLMARFQAGQVGRVYRGLTLDDGSLVLTGNYLKLRIAPALTRNQWVRVRVTSDRDGELLAG
jgi:threonylcarbamoyladenosine tRNA methylthiotransferase MtaB